jgi:signal peptidase I
MRSLRWLEGALKTGIARGGTWVLVQGRSMEPTYMEGDWLLVEPLSGTRPIGRGDVVLARRGDRLVGHRVVGLGGGLARTRGDASACDDEPIPIGSVIGRVVGARPGTGMRARMRRLGRTFRRLVAAPPRGAR